MHEEEIIASLGVVFLSLYQCAPSKTSSSKTASSRLGISESTCVLSDHRGDVLVPFYCGRMTYKELAAGMEYRLNQYFVMHPVNPSQTRILRGKNTELECGSCSCSYSFNGAYFCSKCDVNTGSEAFSLKEGHKLHDVVKEYPRVVVRNFTRLQCTGVGNSTAVYEVVDENWNVTEAKLCCFFYTQMEKSTEDTSSILTKDGGVIRPLIQRDHMRAYASESVYGDNGKAKRYIELKVGDHLLRVGTSAGQRFEDVFQRLKKRNVHVHRLFDGVTGASILPCELVRHLSWRVSSLCASVVTPLLRGLAAKRGCKGDGSLREDDVDDLVELGTLITLSEMPPDVYTNSTVRIVPDSDVSSYSDRDRLLGGQNTLQNNKQQQQQIVIGFYNNDEDDTVPIVNCVSPERQMEPEESDTPMRSYYLDDDSYTSPRGGFFSTMESVDVASTPMREDDKNHNVLLVDENCRRTKRRLQFSQPDCNNSSSIMVTQQTLPDFFPCDSDEEDDG